MHKIDIIVISPGKCGSTTLRDTLKQHNFACIKAHNPDCFREQFGYNGLSDTIKFSSANKPLYIIDSYRLPIERQISAFFHSLDILVPNYATLSVAQLIDIFNSRCLSYSYKRSYINNIMEQYNTPLITTFDFNKGYTVRKTKNIIFIRLLFKDINIWGKLLSELFNTPITIVEKQLSKRKKYYKLYEEFKEQYKVPKRYLDFIQQHDDDFHIFNTKSEQHTYIAKWTQSSI